MLHRNVDILSIFILMGVFLDFRVFAESGESGSSSSKDRSDNSNQQSPQPPSIAHNGVPTGFEKVLPANIVKQLQDLHSNTQLSFPEKRKKFDDIMNSVPGEIIAKLPPPPGFELLPQSAQEQIKAIHTNTSLSWNEKHKEIAQIIDSLPEEDRIRIPPGPAALRNRNLNFPLAPPPGFEKVLPKDVYAQLIQIHQDPHLLPKDKVQRIDKLIRSQPQEILNNLPLPPGFDQLPTETLKQARKIFSNKTLDYEEKNKAIIRFVKSLPEDQRALVRPPLPPALNQLPQKVKDKIESVFLNEQLNEEQRDVEFWKIVNGLPDQDRRKIHRELDGFRGPSGPQGNTLDEQSKSE